MADPAHKCVNLGACMVRDNVRRLIPIVNHSPAPITFTLALTPTEPGLQNREVLAVSPRDAITLEARGGTAKVEVWFRPKARIPQFTEEVSPLVFVIMSGQNMKGERSIVSVKPK